MNLVSWPAASIASIVVMIALCAILIAMLGCDRHSTLTRILESRHAQSLGRVSFSFYLFNVPVLYLIWAFTDRWEGMKGYPIGFGLLVGLVSVGLTWPFALWSYRLIERPSIEIARQVSGRIARASPR